MGGIAMKYECYDCKKVFSSDQMIVTMIKVSTPYTTPFAITLCENCFILRKIEKKRKNEA